MPGAGDHVALAPRLFLHCRPTTTQHAESDISARAGRDSHQSYPIFAGGPGL